MALNPIELQKHLKGVNYPASKQDLLDAAQSNGKMDDDVRQALESLPDQQFEKPTDVTAALKDEM